MYYGQPGKAVRTFTGSKYQGTGAHSGYMETDINQAPSEVKPRYVLKKSNLPKLPKVNNYRSPENKPGKFNMKYSQIQSVDMNQLNRHNPGHNIGSINNAETGIGNRGKNISCSSDLNNEEYMNQPDPQTMSLPLKSKQPYTTQAPHLIHGNTQVKQDKDFKASETNPSKYVSQVSESSQNDPFKESEITNKNNTYSVTDNPFSDLDSGSPMNKKFRRVNKEAGNNISLNNVINEKGKNQQLPATANQSFLSFNDSVENLKKMNNNLQEENTKLHQTLKERNMKIVELNNKCLNTVNEVNLLKQKHKTKIETLTRNLDNALTNLARLQKIVVSQSHNLEQYKKINQSSKDSVFTIIDSISKNLPSFIANQKNQGSRSNRTNGNNRNNVSPDDSALKNRPSTDNTELVQSSLNQANASSGNVTSSISKLKKVVDLLIRKEDTLKKKIEEVLYPTQIEEEDSNGFELDGLVVNIEKAGEKLADFSNPFYIPSGAPETILEKKDYYIMSNYPDVVNQEVEIKQTDYEDLDNEITKRILKGEGFDSVFQDPTVQNLFFGKNSSKESNK